MLKRFLRYVLIALYIVIQKRESFFNQKNVKITKQAHTLNVYPSSCNVRYLNSFNPEVQLKNTESETKSKLKNIISIKKI